jgi:DHA2 family multidrug resistance protein
MAPRGIGTMAAMMFAGRYSTRIDARLLMGLGIVMLCWSFWVMTGWTPDITERDVALVIVVQGAGLGLVFIPLQVLAFATLPVALRTDGASLFSLFRNIGAAIGVSVTSDLLAHNAQSLHAEIGAYVNPFNRALQHGAARQLLDPLQAHGAAVLDHMVNQQAQIISYVDDYRMMIFTTAPALLLLLLMRRPRAVAPAAPGESHAAMD